MPAPRIPRLPNPKPGTIAAVIDNVEHCGPILTAERAMLWAHELFAPNEVKAWLDAGLQTADLGLIIDFRTLSVPPEAMGWSVRGEAVLERIRIGQHSAQAIARTLRKPGFLIPESD